MNTALYFYYFNLLLFLHFIYYYYYTVMVILRASFTNQGKLAWERNSKKANYGN